jgi:hypothetical protein
MIGVVKRKKRKKWKKQLEIGEKKPFSDAIINTMY